MKFLISMILLLSITISAQTTLEKEIEKIKSNPNVKLHYLENNNLKIDYDKFTSRTFYLSNLKGNAKKQYSIPRFVFNLWELDTSLYIYKYQFWQEVPLGNYYKKPIIGDINGDNRIEYYGHKKDFFTENSGVYCYQQNAYGLLNKHLNIHPILFLLIIFLMLTEMKILNFIFTIRLGLELIQLIGVRYQTKHFLGNLCKFH